MDRARIATCIRIADEYRARNALGQFAIDDQEARSSKLDWRAAFPDKWSDNGLGRLGQGAVALVLLPFTLFAIYRDLLLHAGGRMVPGEAAPPCPIEHGERNYDDRSSVVGDSVR